MRALLLLVLLFNSAFCFTPAWAQSQPTVLRARALQPGDTVMVVATSRAADRDATAWAKKRLEAWGLKVEFHPDLFAKDGYLAGTDAQRAGQVMDAFLNPQIAAVLPITGGFGVTRMLDQLDYDVIRRHPKVLIGYSDITGLHLAIHRKTGLITFHGPNLDSGFGRPEDLTKFSRHWLEQAVLAPDTKKEGGEQANANEGYTIRWLRDGETVAQYAEACDLQPPETLHAGTATGQLIGGNLSLVAALMGTPYEIETAGKILFIEDIGEAPYRVDRMLSTMRLAGKLDQLAGVLLGQFTYRDDQDTSIKEGPTVDEVVEGYFKPLGVPVVRNFPVGHHRCNATLPIGAVCELDTAKGTLRVLQSPTK